MRVYVPDRRRTQLGYVVRDAARRAEAEAKRNAGDPGVAVDFHMIADLLLAVDGDSVTRQRALWRARKARSRAHRKGQQAA